MNDRRSFEAIKPSTLDPWLVFGFLCLVPCAFSWALALHSLKFFL